MHRRSKYYLVVFKLKIELSTQFRNQNVAAMSRHCQARIIFFEILFFWETLIVLMAHEFFNTRNTIC